MMNIDRMFLKNSPAQVSTLKKLSQLYFLKLKILLSFVDKI